MLRLDHTSLAMAEFHKSKLLAWNPRQIEIGRDAADWAALAGPERDVVTRLLWLFGAAQSTALRHLPALSIALDRRAAPPGDLLAAAAGLAEVARHVDAYDRWLAELGGETAGSEFEPPTFAHDPHYRALIEEDLPVWLDMLLGDSSDAALMRAIGTCHLVVEGVLIEAGHAALSRALRRHELLPGLCYMLDLARRDVVRHADVGAGWLAGLIETVGERGDPESEDRPGVEKAAGSSEGSAEDPARVTPDAIRTFLGPRLRYAAGALAAVFAPWGQAIPLGIDLDQLAEDARGQLGARMDRVVQPNPAAGPSEQGGEAISSSPL